ncbi:hypothetical protein [Emticicia agri]|uniref:Uncharacterized protein n=1 Tax=Emticicia agri TaxID=2492393 RepID=A0A4Q5M5H8_9BACT|nr:hypothetical protein [Emticicia agri]RYU97698.1 hypothetical protein EWM59_00820 [Emticicia agri]
MNHTVSAKTPAGRIVMGATLGGLVIMGLVALGISEYDGYVDELLVYQSLALGLIGGLILSGFYLLFTRIKAARPPKYQPPIIGYTSPLQSKRTAIVANDMAIATPAERKSLFKRILSSVAYFSAYTLIGMSLGFLGGVIFLCFNLNNIFDDASNQYSFLMFIFLPLQLIATLLVSMAIGGVAGGITGFVLKIVKK